MKRRQLRENKYVNYLFELVVCMKAFLHESHPLKTALLWNKELIQFAQNAFETLVAQFLSQSETCCGLSLIHSV